MNKAIEQLAWKKRLVVLTMEHEAVEFYIKLLHDYNEGEDVRDDAVYADEQSLRKQYELLFDEEVE